ncbi:MAG: NUDIX hydrolase [Patescibacteria group bacterium]
MPLKASPYRAFVWFFTRPKLQGTSCILRCGNEVLLVDYKYGSGWNFPTGLIQIENESPQDAAHRELRTEFSIRTKMLQYIGYVFCRFQCRRDRIFCFVVELNSKDVDINNKDIRGIQWVSIPELENITISPFSKEIIARWFKKQRQTITT